MQYSLLYPKKQSRPPRDLKSIVSRHFRSDFTFRFYVARATKMQEFIIFIFYAIYLTVSHIILIGNIKGIFLVNYNLSYYIRGFYYLNRTGYIQLAVKYFVYQNLGHQETTYLSNTILRL